MLFDAMIIDPNPSSRGFLWQATLANPRFHRVTAYSKFNAALKVLEDGAHYDGLLISR